MFKTNTLANNTMPLQILKMSGRWTLRPFGPEPFGHELRVERLKAEGLSIGCKMAQNLLSLSLSQFPLLNCDRSIGSLSLPITSWKVQLITLLVSLMKLMGLFEELE